MLLGTPQVSCTLNRQPNLDPLLMGVKILKVREIENPSRKVLPAYWETAFDVLAVLADTHGSTTRVRINLFAFLMNKECAKQVPMSFIKEWLPSNLAFVGEVGNAAVVIQRLPEYTRCLPPSSVSIDEVDEDEDEDEGEGPVVGDRMMTTEDPNEFAAAYANRQRAKRQRVT